MHWLIDGYNVMHAGGRLGPKLSARGFAARAVGFSMSSQPLWGRIVPGRRQLSSMPRFTPATSLSMQNIADWVFSSPSAMKMPTRGSSY